MDAHASMRMVWMVMVLPKLCHSQLFGLGVPGKQLIDGGAESMVTHTKGDKC